MPDPRRIVLVTTDFRPMVGGVADYLHRLAESLTLNTDVTVLTSVPQNGAAPNRSYRLQPLAPLPKRLLGRRLGDAVAPIRKLHTTAYFLALRRYADRLVTILQQDDDVAVLIGIWDTASHFWCDACRRAGVPYYLAAYGVELLIPLYGRLPGWRRRDFAGAARVIAISRATADLASRQFGLEKPPVIVNPGAGPPPARRDVDARAEQMQRALGLQGSGPVLLTVGRLVPRKGFDLVLQSVAHLRRDYPDVRYLIAGEGPGRARLEARARELGINSHVHLLGQVDELTKWAAYDLCDVFVMPNRSLEGTDFEGFGIVFVEAALAGRPSIAGRSGGTTDAVIDEVTGLLVDSESPDELTAALRRLLGDPALRKRLGRAGEERARNQFSPSALAGSLRAQLGWT